MGMTREEIVKSMSVQDAIQVLKDTNTYGTADIAKSVAIDTMHKYQKIEQIVDKWNEGIYDDEVLKDDSSSEKPTGSDDCISRFSAKQIIRNHYCSIPSKVFKKIIEELDNISSATPIRPKGHWQKIELPSRDAHECSDCCGLGLLDENNEQLTDFCPSCGADMREVGE